MKPPRSSETKGLLQFSRSLEDDSDEEWKIDGNGFIREMAQRIQLHQGNIYSFSGNYMYHMHATHSLVYTIMHHHHFMVSVFFSVELFFPVFFGLESILHKIKINKKSSRI